MSSETIPAFFARAVAEFSARPAVRAPAGEWTYAELGRRADSVAAEVLRERGENSGPVALLCAHDAPLIAAILGVLKADKIYVALDPGHSPAQIKAMLDSSQAKLLLADEANWELAKSFASENLAVVSIAEKFSGDPQIKFPKISAGAGAWLMFTSGSTGTPKGVWQNHAGLVHEAEVYAELAGIVPGDRVSLLAACGLSASGATLFGTLLRGATLCVFPLRSQGVERLADWLEREEINIFHTVPTVFRHLARMANTKNAFAKMKLIRLGGEPVLRADVENFQKLCPDGCRFMQSLSSTETGLMTTFALDKKTVLSGQRVPVGRAVRGVEIFLVDENNRQLQNGGEGKIAVRSPRLRQGYWQQPGLTAEKFLPDAQNLDSRIFISNDLGKFLPDGALEHLGRADQLVKISGQRVDLGEVEAALTATGLFEESAANAPEDASGERRLIAYIVPHAGADVSAQSCRRALRPLLAEHMVPMEFVLLSRLPQTSAGKLDRRALPMPVAKLRPTEGDKPRDRFEMKLAEIWRKTLRLDAVGMNEDFFELGGDSLRAVEVLVQVEEIFGVSLSPSALAEHSTIAQLAAVVAGHALARSQSPLVQLRASATGRPLFLVHNGHGDITTFARLARRLPDRPVYGLQSVGLDGTAWPLMSVAEMAKRYLQEVIKIDPDGPYLIGGTCMGGLVAFEMARQLVQSGQRVGMLALIVTPAPPFTGYRSRWHELLMDPLRDAFRILRWRAIRLLRPTPGPRRLAAYRHFIAGMNSRAARNFRPAIYPGKITVVTTTDMSGFREDRRQLMSKYARDSEIIAMSFPRKSILSPPAVDELALLLGERLIAAESAPSPAPATAGK